jgi:Family of unknown function (DUF6314)
MIAVSAHEGRDARYPVADLRAYLTGAWRVGRTLEDRRRGARGRFDGGASFTPGQTGALACREEGRLALAGFETVAHQSYLYTFPAPFLAEVRFADGRPFHPLDLRDGVWTAEHLCGADLYRGAFRALGPDRWQAEWEISGPCKDQVLRGLFTRAA